MVPKARSAHTELGAVAVRLRIILVLVLALAGLTGGELRADDMDAPIPLRQAASGGLYVTGRLAPDVQAEFLVDTGSGLVTISRSLMRQLDPEQRLEPVRRSAARLANGALQVIEVYRLEQLRIGAGCDLGPVEVAVLERDGRNILGLGALSHGAPFGFRFSPPTLLLSGCDTGGGI